MCNRLPPIATTGLHRGSIFRCLYGDIWSARSSPRSQLWSCRVRNFFTLDRALTATQMTSTTATRYEEIRMRNDERNAPIRHPNNEFAYKPPEGGIDLKGPFE
jgi:hypothetical protein